MSARAKRILPVVLLVSACEPTPTFTAADRQAVASEVRATLAELTEAMNDHRVQVLSPTAAVALQRGSSSRAPALFWTRVLVKEDGRWVITYEHQSWPGCDPPPAPHPYTAPGDSAGLLP
jgi:hypothetical protein